MAQNLKKDYFPLFGAKIKIGLFLPRSLYEDVQVCIRVSCKLGGSNYIQIQ